MIKMKKNCQGKKSFHLMSFQDGTYNTKNTFQMEFFLKIIINITKMHKLVKMKSLAREKRVQKIQPNISQSLEEDSAEDSKQVIFNGNIQNDIDS